ncbi:phasin family protein [Breoghania sp. JC706]|uniref:phasin family protein n=1 Tax=Breoghania sp. JC706 TaxID=3117732 RepID=UPI00300BAA1D
MPRQTKTASKDPSVVPLPWLDPSWMEKADMFGSRFFDQFAKMNIETLEKTETLIEDHMSFVRGRVHTDFEYAKALSKARDPMEATRIMSEFWEKMVSDYSACAESNGEKMREFAARACETGMEMAEVSGEAASSVEEAISKATKSSAAA